MNIGINWHHRRRDTLEVEWKEEEAEDVTLVGSEQCEETMQEVIVVDETHEDGTETNRRELVSHTCSIEVLAHAQE